jgi:hypothetical protein
MICNILLKDIKFENLFIFLCIGNHSLVKNLWRNPAEMDVFAMKC